MLSASNRNLLILFVIMCLIMYYFGACDDASIRGRV